MAAPIFTNDKSIRSLSEFDFLHEPSDKSSKLGAGSFASVKLAKEKKTGKQYAIKIISMEPSKMTNSDLHNIKTEISIHKKLDHPNIVKFYDYIQKDSNVYLVLDYAQSGNLYSYIHKRKGLSSDEVFRFFHQTCLAFQYLHQNDVLHRDLKPENLLLDKNHNIKLCDFGWATRRITEKRSTFCGTYEYMAPEMVFKKPYDYRVDIWSLGILLFELIHREAPYKGRSLSDISKSLSKSQITFSSSINPEAKDLILKILRTDPSERLSIAQILSHPWVQSHLSSREDAKSQNPEVLVSPREVRPALVQSVNEEIPQLKSRREHEFFKSEILVNGDNKLYDEVSNYQSRKHSNACLLSSVNTPSSLKEREKHVDKAKEKLREKVKLSSPLVGNGLNYSEVQRSPLNEFSFNNSSKLNSEIPLSARGHNKSSSSTNNFLADKSNLDEIKNLKDLRKKKILENTMLSPNFRAKIDTVVHQISSHTTTHRTAESTSSFFSPKVSNQGQQPTAQISSSEAPLVYYGSNENNQTYSQNIRNKTFAKVSVSDKTIDYNPSVTPSSSFRLKMSPENARIFDQMKSNFQKRMNLPKGNTSPIVPSPLSTRNLTTRPKLDVMNQETNFVFPTKYSKMETTKHSINKDFENILSVAEPNKYRSQNRQDVSASLNKSYKTLDYKRSQDLKISEDISNINLHLSSLSTRRNENKENKKESIRDKEGHMRLREENAGKWAF